MTKNIITSTKEVNGISFQVPMGYNSIQDFASVCRLNLKTVQNNPKFSHLLLKYKKLVEKLISAGL